MSLIGDGDQSAQRSRTCNLCSTDSVTTTDALSTTGCSPEVIEFGLV